MSMLKVENLSVHYGMIQAVRDVSFEVNEGEVVSLIGANGAGKTSILRTISGLVRPSAGKIEFLGQEIQKVPAQKIVAAGLSQVPEGRHVFPGLTVMENLEMGAFLKKDREENQANLKKVFSRFPRLEERKNQDAATLSGGEQQMLAMGRALMSTPKLLLLDEHTAALDPKTSEMVMELTQKIVESHDLTTLMITHDMNHAIEYGNRLIMLYQGKIVVDVKGEEKKNLTVEDLMRLFHQNSGETLVSDELVLG